MVRALTLSLTLSLACGGRTPLGVDFDSDAAFARSDASVDSGHDGGLDAGFDAGFDAGSCEPRDETCDGTDEDCDGLVDEGLPLVALGDRIILRDDEFDTGDCTSCSWAFHPQLVPLEDGWLALWTLGVYGSRERPNLYGRRLDERGAPLEEVRLLSEQILLDVDTVPTAAGADESQDTLLIAEVRHGADDFHEFLRIDRQGNLEFIPTSYGRRDPYTAAIRTSGGALLVRQEGSFDDRRLQLHRFGPDLVETRAPMTIPETQDVVSFQIAGRPSAFDLEPEAAVFFQIRTRLDFEWRVARIRSESVVATGTVAVPPMDRFAAIVGGARDWFLFGAQRASKQFFTFRVNFSGMSSSDTGGWRFAQNQFGATTLRAGDTQLVRAWQWASNDPDANIHVAYDDDRDGLSLPPAADERYEGENYFAEPSLGLDAQGELLLIWQQGAPDRSPNRVMFQRMGCGMSPTGG